MKSNQNNQPDLSLIWNKMWNWNVYNNEELRKFKNLDKLRIIKELGLKSNNDQKIFDGGCGDGLTLLTFMKEFGCEGYGIDISDEALMKAKANFKEESKKIDLQKGDVRALPYENYYFNVCLSFGVIEHFLDYEKAVQEIYRVLKPGGVAVFVQPHLYSFAPLYRLFRQWQGKWNCGFQFEFSGKRLGSELLKCGFSEYKYRVEAPYKDMPYVYPFDKFIRIFSKKWGHYLFLIAKK